MKVLGVDHITINVTDLESSEVFYGQVLALEKAGFIHMGDHTLTYYKLAGGCRLELIKYLTESDKADVRETSQGIYRHFCIETDDINGVFEACVSSHLRVRKEPSFVEKLGCDTMLIVDPNGVEIEIIQR